MVRKIKVLSLFDGISCGMVALERAEIPVERYVAYEIDKYAIKVSQKNYPQIEQCGDVTTADFTQHKDFDLLIGGSPCTYWSIAKKGRETTPDGVGGQLFMHYVRALKESGCKYFLYENNYSIHKDIKAFISEQLGVEPIMINSALVSAQQRKRCYWTNIPNVQQPKDKEILLQDILDYSLDYQINLTNYKLKKIEKYANEHQNKTPVMFNAYNCSEITDKSPTMTSACGIANTSAEVCLFEPILLNAKDGKSQTIKATSSNVSIANMVRKDGYGATGVALPIRVGTVAHGGNANYNSKQWRVYSIAGKSVTICGQGGGAGAKTGLHKIDLPNGDYIIRKLTPLEAERLQTLPDNYTAGVSNTQRYKCIGNGWTIDVITHILKGLKKGVS